MAKTAEQAVVSKNVRVNVPIERAFSVFVEQMEIWWPPSHHIAPQPFESIFIEPRVGGRWYERDGQGNTCDWGQVLAWEPPYRVTLSWHLGPDWKYNPDITKASEVEIRFTAEGPSSTLVELEHRAIERHGEDYQQFAVMLDSPNAWAGILAAFVKTISASELSAGKEAR